MIVKYFEEIKLNRAKNFLHFNLMQKIANCLTDGDNNDSTGGGNNGGVVPPVFG